MIHSDHKRIENKTLCTHLAVGLIQGSLPARANGSQSREVGLPLLQLSFLYLLQLKREDNEFVNIYVFTHIFCMHTWTHCHCFIHAIYKPGFRGKCTLLDEAAVAKYI